MFSFQLFGALSIRGRVSLKDAEARYYVLEDYGISSGLEEPRQVFFGKMVIE